MEAQTRKRWKGLRWSPVPEKIRQGEKENWVSDYKGRVLQRGMNKSHSERMFVVYQFNGILVSNKKNKLMIHVTV